MDYINTKVRYNGLFYSFAISVLIVIMASERAYFLWELKETYLCIAVSFLGLFYLSHRIRFTVRLFVTIVLYIAALFWMTEYKFVGYIGLIIEATSILLLLFMTKDEQVKLLSIITNVFAVLVAISTFFYLLSFVVSIPSFGKISYGGYDFINHLFYLEAFNVNMSSSRFSAFILEPGHLGVFCNFLLFANKYDFRNKANIVFLIAILLSFSLAGFILLPIGYLFNAYGSGRKISSTLIVTILACVGLAFFALNYNHGDNIVNDLIFSRLQFDEENGIKGNNRNQIAVDVALVSAFSNGDIISGYGLTEVVDRYSNAQGQLGAGYKVYLLSRGLIGTAFVLALYISLVLKSDNKKNARFFFLLYLFSFLAQDYLLWFSWISIFVLGSHSSLLPVSKKR